MKKMIKRTVVMALMGIMALTAFGSVSVNANANANDDTRTIMITRSGNMNVVEHTFTRSEFLEWAATRNLIGFAYNFNQQNIYSPEDFFDKYHGAILSVISENILNNNFDRPALANGNNLLTRPSSNFYDPTSRFHPNATTTATPSTTGNTTTSQPSNNQGQQTANTPNQPFANPTEVHRDEWLEIVRLTHSGIELPNRRLTNAERNAWIDRYNELGGANAFELEIVRLINEIRTAHNLATLEIDVNLMMAARFYTETMYAFGRRIGHNIGPYATNPNAGHGASANIAAAFGATLSWGGGNGGGGITPQMQVDDWMNSPPHRRYVLSPEHRFIGVGSHGHANYMFLSDSN